MSVIDKIKLNGTIYDIGNTPDPTPTQGSTNAVQSGGVYDALHDTDNTLTQARQAADAKATGDEIYKIVPPNTNLVTLKNISNGIVISTQGVETSNSSYKTSDYIPVTPSGTYYFKGISYIAIYNQSKTFRTRMVISGGEASKTLNSTDYYIRISSNKSTDEWQMNNGDTALDYMIPDIRHLSGDIELSDHLDATLTEHGKAAESEATGLAISSISDKFDKVAHDSTNIVTLKNLSEGIVISANGVENENASYNSSDYVKVKPNTAYYVIGTPYIAEYNASKIFIKRSSVTSSGGVLMTNENTGFIRFTSNKRTDSWQANEGSQALEYEKPDKIYLGKEVVVVNQLADMIKGLKTVTPLYGTAFTPSLPYKYKGETIVPYTTSGYLSDIYSLWDSLATQYPQYVTKTVLGMDASNTYEIRSYRVDNGASFAASLPRIMWLSNIHGNEANSAISTYYMIKELLENFVTDPTCYAILSAVRLYVIPAVNPWGVENYSRLNSNNVNLNRNFPCDWIYRDPTLPYGTSKYGIESAENVGGNPYYFYGGGTVVYDDVNEIATTTYVAEPETTIIMNYINSLNTGTHQYGTILFAVNKHDAGPMSSEAALIYVEDNYEGDRTLLTTLGNWMKPQWMATQNWLTEKNGVNFSTVKAAITGDSSRAGTMDKWINAIGIHGCLLEIPPYAGSSYTDQDHRSDLCKVNVEYGLTMLGNIVSHNALLNDNTQTYTYVINT